ILGRTARIREGRQGRWQEAGRRVLAVAHPLVEGLEHPAVVLRPQRVREGRVCFPAVEEVAEGPQTEVIPHISEDIADLRLVQSEPELAEGHREKTASSFLVDTVTELTERRGLQHRARMLSASPRCAPSIAVES